MRIPHCRLTHKHNSDVAIGSIATPEVNSNFQRSRDVRRLDGLVVRLSATGDDVDVSFEVVLVIARPAVEQRVSACAEEAWWRDDEDQLAGHDWRWKFGDDLDHHAKLVVA